MSRENSHIYQMIKYKAAELGFADFGCAAAGEIADSARSHYLNCMNKGYFAKMHYLHRNLEKRFNPCNLVDGALSVLVFLAPYSLPGGTTPPNGISQYALGKDYHQVIKGKLFQIMEMLAKEFNNFQGRAFTDSAPVMERAWGVKACLGFVGKNNFLISKSCGIKNFIGTIICNVPIPETAAMEPDKKSNTTGSCGECHRCIDACPSKALYREYTLDANKCISYHTIENRELEEDIAKGLVPDFSGKFFGCDNCLNACPWNSRNLPGWSDFHTNAEMLQETGKEWWMNLSAEEFNSKFKESPLLRGGLKNIQTALNRGKNVERNG